MGKMESETEFVVRFFNGHRSMWFSAIHFTVSRTAVILYRNSKVILK